ncbi:MAG TPA: TonB-dependent receptor [Cyclobacteriaceae bacterium]|nr:TonB-dependent receptor [Cyclobacteriaceae bacterium]
MAQRILPLVFALLITSAAFGQIGTIKGTIKDATSGEGIIGANVVIEGTTQGASTDLEGNFVITKIKAGKYNLVVTYISYRTKNIPGVEVYPDQSTVVNTSIEEDIQQLDDVVVTARRQTDTDISVITEIKKADLIAVGISSQMIQMSQDRDASQVIRRVPGVTIVGNKFVNVRGLSERYSTVLLNGIIAPSTEVDSKAFAFDLIPSNMIDRMMVFKSGSPELPGEFAGADINIFTKNVVEENSASLSVSGSYRFATTGQDFQLGVNKSGTDWLGFSSKRGLPSSFPIENLRAFSQTPNDINQAKLINATQSLPNTWATRSMNASPDFRVNFDISRTMRLGKMKLDNITSISYAHTNQKLSNLKQYYYDRFDESQQKSDPRYAYNDTRFTQTNRFGVVSNFTFEINPSNKIEFRNFYNQQGQNQATIRKGFDGGVGGYDVNNLSLNYYERGIYSGQLSGKHSFSDAVNFNWILGYNNTSANQPDYQRVRSQRDIGTENPFNVIIPPNASSFDAGRFFSTLKEEAYTFAGNLDIKLNSGAEESKQVKVIAGYYLEQKDRAFNARWMSYKWANSSSVDLSLLSQPFNQVFSQPNLGTRFILEEGTNQGPSLYDRYDGHNQLGAGYAGIVAPFADRWRVTGGLRVEYNRQLIDVYDENGKKINKTDSPVTVPMPFMNLSYNFSDKMLMRVAYSRTVNRPVFRELAPFNYYDFDRNSDIFGNPDLKTARIDNIDVKWELYPSSSENISLGVFYKLFSDPIEQYLAPGSNLIYSYTNADKATNYGVEAEVRKSLDNVTDNNFLKRLTFIFNGALVASAIALPESLDNLDHNRAMQGQSPYIINGSLFYNHPEAGWQASVMYNVFGKRIFAVGDKDANPNQYEMSRHQVDLTISKRVTEKLEVKIGIQDLLNQSYRLVQDSNRDKKITGVDETIQTYKFGQYSTLGVTWRF